MHRGRCYFLFTLLALACLLAPGLRLNAQDRTYEPTPGLPRVKASLVRLKIEGDKLSAKVRNDLQVEGQAFLDLEQKYSTTRSKVRLRTDHQFSQGNEGVN